MRWLLVALFTTAAALAAGQNAQLPDGDGKAIVSAACTTCHGVDLITAKSVSRADWAGTVDRMKTYGVTLDATQTTTVIDYLAKSFGPKGAAPTAPAAPASQDSAAADAAGKALIDEKCAGCHGLDLITGKTANRVDWTATLDRMKSYGASLDDKQTTTMLDYLLKHYGPKEQAAAPAPGPAAAAAAAAPDAGKNILNASCANCHDLDLVTNRTGSEAEWREVVERMNARGAAVADKDVAVLVSYLAKTYPNKK